MSSQSNGRSIGLVVLASLLEGLTLAVIFVLLPFAGARENVISGTVLLAFAIGWASLAVLSTRITDQAQRWARVPAVLSACRDNVAVMVWVRDSRGTSLAVADSAIGARGMDGHAKPEAPS